MKSKISLACFLAAIGLFQEAFAQAEQSSNIIRAKAPIEFAEQGEWLIWSPSIGPDYDVATLCDEWLPDASTVDEGQFFEQTANCYTTSSHSVQQREIHSVTGQVRNAGKPTVETSGTQSTKKQQVTGTNKATDTFTVVNPVVGQSGIYTVKNQGSTFTAYVDMVTDGGKWVLAARWINSKTGVSFNDIVVHGKPLKTQTTDAVNFPAIPSGEINTAGQALVISGNASWQAKYGTWQEFSTFAPGTVLTNAGFPVRGSSGSYTLYHSRAAWGSPQTMDQLFTLWTVPNNTGPCGGAGVVGSNKMCVAISPGMGNHADLTSVKSLYLKAK